MDAEMNLRETGPVLVVMGIGIAPDARIIVRRTAGNAIGGAARQLFLDSRRAHQPTSITKARARPHVAVAVSCITRPDGTTQAMTRPGRRPRPERRRRVLRARYLFAV